MSDTIETLIAQRKACWDAIADLRAQLEQSETALTEAWSNCELQGKLRLATVERIEADAAALREVLDNVSLWGLPTHQIEQITQALSTTAGTDLLARLKALNRLNKDACAFEDELLKLLNVRERKDDHDATDDIRIIERCKELLARLQKFEDDEPKKRSECVELTQIISATFEAAEIDKNEAINDLLKLIAAYAELASLRAELEKVKADWQHEHTRKVDLDHDCDSLRAENQRLQREVKQTHLEYDEVKRQLANANAENQHENAVLEKQVEELRAGYAALVQLVQTYQMTGDLDIDWDEFPAATLCEAHKEIKELQQYKARLQAALLPIFT